MTTLLNFPSNNFWNQFLNEILQRSTGSFLAHDVHHSFTNLTNLSTLCVCSLFDLIWSAFGESNDEDTQEVSIAGLDVGVGFDESLPFTYEGFKFVAGERHAREIG